MKCYGPLGQEHDESQWEQALREWAVPTRMYQTVELDLFINENDNAEWWCECAVGNAKAEVQLCQTAREAFCLATTSFFECYLKDKRPTSAPQLLGG